jgi:hypothetical protein
MNDFVMAGGGLAGQFWGQMDVSVDGMALRASRCHCSRE